MAPHVNVFLKTGYIEDIVICWVEKCSRVISVLIILYKLSLLGNSKVQNFQTSHKIQCTNNLLSFL